jgi:Fe(3+) dicitrate transport protein
MSSRTTRPLSLSGCLALWLFSWVASATAAETAPGSESAEALPTVTIIGTREEARLVPGAVDLITLEELDLQRPFTANEALRRAPGVNVRDEEGFGLRPNIGIRGLNPTRSTKITLLEDGLPLAYAPYGDNASYFHPPIERYRGIEVLRGTNALAYGPQTIGGVINYLTPDAPEDFSGYMQFGGGSRDYLNGHARFGGRGALIDYVRKQGQGARDHLEHAIDDLNFKYSTALSKEHSLKLRLNAYREGSTVTYSGLTQAEYERLGARYNPFGNDGFDIVRQGASLSHRWAPSTATKLDTSVYYGAFDRDWWRQSSTTTDGQCGSAFTARRLAGLAVDADACASVQGRLREYAFRGIESRLRLANALGELTVGAKWHVERQDRRQVNGDGPQARTGRVVEDNLRDTDASAVFVTQRFDLGPVTVTPILRHERIDARRTDRLTGRSGDSRVTKTLPGIGLTWAIDGALTVFAGVHEGFSPPRVEDLISGSGTATEVDPESSTNFEIGLRGEPVDGVRLQLAYFHNDFDNLIAVGSIAGGATPLSQGEALFAGIEASSAIQWRGGVFGNVALTWLDKAEQTTAFRNVANQSTVGVAGNRQPYSPEFTATVALGFSKGPLSMQVDLQHLSEQFSDFSNTVAGSADGQRGIIDAHTLLGATVNYTHNDRWQGFLTVKNLTDQTYIVDRTRGIQLGMPRLVQAGVRVSF